jgi:AraC-like DNA-binding protein
VLRAKAKEMELQFAKKLQAAFEQAASENHVTLFDSLRKSRAVLAERFARFLGEPPLSYLARWRLQLAGRKLQTTQQTILPDHLG